jgi:SAM-dependent methyltransferase
LAGPPPQGQPFFAIDHATPTPLELIEQLAARGIFRKYEHVLDLGGGLGATTRYLTTRLGCTATATARTDTEAAAGRRLTMRAGLDWQLHHAAADPARLPFAEAAFTHVWVLERRAALGPIGPLMAEAFRVLRPGGQLGIQELVLRHPDPGLGGRGFVDVETRCGHFARAGFVDVASWPADGSAAHETTQATAAWQELVRRLGPADPYVVERMQLTEALASGALAVVQLTARRP